MKSTFLSLCLIFGLSANAVADRDDIDLYLQIDGGTAQFLDNEINGQDVEFDQGWSVNGRIGGERERLAAELEFGVHGAPYTPVDSGFSPDVFFTIGANLIFKLIRVPGFDFYGGLGGGFLYDDVSLGFVQFHAHAETGMILRPTRYVQLVPHARAIAIYRRSEPQGADAQYISTARLGLRFSLQP